MTLPNGPVLVGVDGSEQSLVAASWAAEEADLRHARLRLVVVSDDPRRDKEAREVLQGAIKQCRSERPQVEVDEKIARGRSADQLIRFSAEAQLVVVGSRGRGPVAETLLGSVSTAVATHAHCPVVVLRDRRTSFSVGPVVVGVDDSTPSRAALEFAFEAASARQTSLLAMHVWRPMTTQYSWIDQPPGAVWFSLDDAQRKLAEQLNVWRNKYHNVSARNVVQYGHPVDELVAAASHAQLLVVGHRGMGGFEGLLLGSVAHGALHHADCPVAVVRG